VCQKAAAEYGVFLAKEMKKRGALHVGKKKDMRRENVSKEDAEEPRGLSHYVRESKKRKAND